MAALVGAGTLTGGEQVRSRRTRYQLAAAGAVAVVWLLAGCGSAGARTAPPSSAATMPVSAATVLVGPPVSLDTEWTAFGERAFERARRERRYVMLGLESDGCVACRRMDRVTYRDPRVASLLAKQFVAARANVDARPDLEARFGDKWPAVVIFSPDGREVARYQGYIGPDEFAAILAAITSGR